jgi:phosphonatase-like hydrolase
MADRTAGLRLAVLDLAGTMVDDGGLRGQALAAALGPRGLRPGAEGPQDVAAVARQAGGAAEEQLFGRLFPQDQAAARAAAEVFDSAYRSLVAEHGVRPVPGAAEAVGRLREAGLMVCLYSGGTRRSLNLVLDALDWMGLADLSLCPADAGRGRPYPDMVLTALLALDVEDVRQVLVAGGTVADIQAGLRSGAGLVAGVLAGAGSARELAAAGAAAVVGSVRELPELVRCFGRLRQAG